MPVTRETSLVSVVTPFYNSAEHLNACIQSVQAQSHRNFQYILADNCSTDGGDEIAMAAAEADGRIEYVRFDEFLPQLPNFNRALELVSPRAAYVKLALADDLLFETCLELMVDLAERNPSVGIVSSYRLDGLRVKGTGLSLGTQVVAGRELGRRQLRDGHFFVGSPTTVLYRADLVRSRKPFFREASLHADTELAYEILRTEDFGFVHQILSYSRVDPESIRGSVGSYNPHLLDRLLATHLYGGDFFDPAESREVWKEISTRYSRFLARAALALKGGSFWQYHRRGLASVGLSFSRWAIAAQLPKVIAEFAMEPNTWGASVRQLLSRATRTRE